MLGWLDIILRLGAAILVGSVIGLNRELHHKPTGMRTLGLVALGSALAVLAVAQDPQADVSRVIQGVITGVGFLGAGVILHRPTGSKVHGLTTAAIIWDYCIPGRIVWSRCLANPGYRGLPYPLPVNRGWPNRELVA
jgi:putative Mg2+ transporter-C (MgtC) family protein